jgi:arginyl-tRNA synthetase
MNVLALIRERFRGALSSFAGDAGQAIDVATLLDAIRPSQDTRFGDYQANCAMPLGKQLGNAPREVAAQLVERLDVAGLCGPPEIAGPGFINLRLDDGWLTERLASIAADERLGVPRVAKPRTFVLDFSSPNVAKPMHVGHIRSTVIGDALCRMLRFAGDRVISDNHLGDWGTQFGMIIYGYKHFRDDAAYQRRAVEELGRLYRLVNQLVEYHEAREQLPTAEQRIIHARENLEAAKAAPPPPAEKDASKGKKGVKPEKALKRLEAQLDEAQGERDALAARIAAIDSDPQLAALARDHADIGQAVLRETARLHEGDAENRRLWHEILPYCRDEIQQMYRRLGVSFDHEYGESFYQDMLADVVAELQERGLAVESDGAQCIFLDSFDAPMIVRKRDGAFLYATTDLATIRYRMRTFHPDAVLYVVDHRQSEHFAKLFAAARLWGYGDVELAHISFGTILGDDGRPFRTRAGDNVGLESLLDESVRRAFTVVAQNDGAKPGGPEMSESQRQSVAEAVGIAALKYADLSQNRTSDYVFSFDKMLAMNGNTATYLQYSYARVQSIFAKGGVDVERLRADSRPTVLSHPAERALAMQIVRLPEALDEALVDYRPNILTSYLFELGKCYSTFFENCPVLKAESEELRASRLMLCDLTGRVLRQGLELLGIGVIDKM